jgi:hypothetical protein
MGTSLQPLFQGYPDKYRYYDTTPLFSGYPGYGILKSKTPISSLF